MTRFGDRRMLINGELVFGKEGRWLLAVNPVDESVLGRVPDATEVDVNHAVECGSAAWADWAATAAATKGRVLRELAARIQSRAEELVQVEVLDTGTTIHKMRRDVRVAVDALEYYAGLGLETKGRTTPASNDHLHLSLREPYGVVGRIVAFNHPLAFTVSRMAAPLMAGNAVIMKAPDKAPLSATFLAELCADLFPPGIVSILTGQGLTAGVALVRHPKVRRLSLIGSVQTGLAIQRTAAEVGVKHITLELGGKNPMVVCPDADLDKVVPAAVDGMNFSHQGQSCGSTSRLFLHRKVYDRVVNEVLERVGSLRVGDPRDEDVDMGALISAAQRQKVEEFVAGALRDGARLLTGGCRPTGPMFDKGFWYRPTVFADVDPESRLFTEEVFGPVLSIIRWEDEADLLDMVNAVQYGLTAAVWTENMRTAIRLALAIQAGYVWINGVSRHFLGTDFGGTKNSGLGTEEGLDELLSYTETKTVHLPAS